MVEDMKEIVNDQLQKDNHKNVKSALLDQGYSNLVLVLRKIPLKINNNNEKVTRYSSLKSLGNIKMRGDYF